MTAQEREKLLERAREYAEQRDALLNPWSRHKLTAQGKAMKEAIEAVYQRKLSDGKYQI